MDPLDAQNQAMVSSHTLLAFQKPQDEKKVMIRPQSLNCPRCDSTNTKFCYYNNYSLSQPRYFCKACKRYWTQGGTLRNVPVGGGCRKNNKRSSPSSSSSSSSYKAQEQTLVTTNSNTNQLLSSIPTFPRFENKPNSQFGPISCFTNGNTNNDNVLAFLDAVRSGILDTQTGSQDLYYGYGNQEVENNATTTTATIITTTREEYCRGRDGENRGLWNFPWHIGGEESKSDTTTESGKECWDGLNGSSWQEFLNTPLM